MEITKQPDAPKDRMKTISNREGNFLAWTDDFTPPFLYQPSTPYPTGKKCTNCANPHRYYCAKSKLPVCSLECYRAVEIVK